MKIHGCKWISVITRFALNRKNLAQKHNDALKYNHGVICIFLVLGLSKLTRKIDQFLYEFSTVTPTFIIANTVVVFSHTAGNSCKKIKAIIGEEAINGIYFLIQDGVKFEVGWLGGQVLSIFL